MDNQPHPIGAACRLEGDKRYSEPRLVRILNNDAFPIYHVRVGDANASQAPGLYESKVATTAVTHSKLTLVK